jgi:thymidylate synthase (FAD)
MKILKPDFEFMVNIDGEAVLKHLEMCGRECYQSSHKVTEDSASRFVANLIKHGHESVLEHFSFTVHFNVDRGITHEMVRHRIASFSQESTRYCNYENDQFGGEIKVIDIREGIKLDTKMKDMSVHLINEILREWMLAMEDAESHYIRMISLGASPQIARSVLPNSTKSGITITANVREWRKILQLRTPLSAHPQMREIMIPFLSECRAIMPVLFDDILISD